MTKYQKQIVMMTLTQHLLNDMNVIMNVVRATWRIGMYRYFKKSKKKKKKKKKKEKERRVSMNAAAPLKKLTKTRLL